MQVAMNLDEDSSFSDDSRPQGDVELMNVVPHCVLHDVSCRANLSAQHGRLQSHPASNIP